MASAQVLDFTNPEVYNGASPHFLHSSADGKTATSRVLDGGQSFIRWTEDGGAAAIAKPETLESIHGFAIFGDVPCVSDGGGSTVWLKGVASEAPTTRVVLWRFPFPNPQVLPPPTSTDPVCTDAFFTTGELHFTDPSGSFALGTVPGAVPIEGAGDFCMTTRARLDVNGTHSSIPRISVPNYVIFAVRDMERIVLLEPFLGGYMVGPAEGPYEEHPVNAVLQDSLPGGFVQAISDHGDHFLLGQGFGDDGKLFIYSEGGAPVQIGAGERRLPRRQVSGKRSRRTAPR